MFEAVIYTIKNFYYCHIMKIYTVLHSIENEHDGQDFNEKLIYD